MVIVLSYVLIFDDICWLLVVYFYICWYSLILVRKCKTRPFRHTSFSKPEGPSIYRFAHSLRIAYMIYLGSRGPVAYFQLRYSLSSVDSLFIWIDSLWYFSILLIVDCIRLYFYIFIDRCWSVLAFAYISWYLSICVDRCCYLLTIVNNL